MKTLLTIMVWLWSVALFAQNVQYENLENFDKLVVRGNLESLEVYNSEHNKPMVIVNGIDKSNVSIEIKAGVLYLDLDSKKEARISIANSMLHRIETTDHEVEFLGIDVMGHGGKYLITERNSDRYVSHHLRIDIPKIEAIHIPDFDFDSDFEFEMDSDFDVCVEIGDDYWEWKNEWDVNQEEIQFELRKASHEVRDEIREALREVQRELRNVRIDF